MTRWLPLLVLLAALLAAVDAPSWPQGSCEQVSAELGDEGDPEALAFEPVSTSDDVPLTPAVAHSLISEGRAVAVKVFHPPI